ncbi:MAG: gliding motility-associated C-terminal domain-containing protein [Bacteroidetes bacterium]|nr:gliding motility-associated C-terminal domain-containing protein [Bacteroidota bacterium]
MRFLLTLIVILLYPFAKKGGGIVQAQIISTVAGSGAPPNNMGYSGDGGPATNAKLNNPSAVAVDALGNFFFFDNNSVIRKVSIATGIITTVVGTGTPGYSGDGGPAIAAQIENISGMAFDAAGNLYLPMMSDFGGVIRKVDTAGIITTVIGTIAGTGTMYCGGDGGPATAASLQQTSGMAFDAAGNIYISDAGCYIVRKIDASGIITTIAGNRQSSYSGDGGPATLASMAVPSGVAVDPLGNVYISDNGSSTIRKVNTAGIISTIAGSAVLTGYSGDGGPAIAALIENPAGIVSDAAGNLYFADVINFRIRKIDTAGIITTVVGSGPASYNHQGAGVGGFSGDGGLATAAKIGLPCAIALDANACNLYLTDGENNRIRKVSNYGPTTVNSATICAGTAATLTANGASAYNWQPTTGLSTATGSTVASTNTTSITYTVTGTTNRCPSTATASVLVYPAPVVDFDYTPQPITMLAPQVQFINQSSSDSIVGYHWNFGDVAGNSDTSNLINPAHTYSEVGTYNVTLMAIGNHNCSSTTTKPITINEYNLYVPNVFTPNGDGINDVFFIKSVGLNNFNFKIYDRWGALVYQWFDANAGWNGETKNGSICVSGTYYYVFTYLDSQGNKQEKKGFFELLR